MVPPALPRPLVPRHLGRPGRPHVAGVWQRPPDAPCARPTREDAEPRPDLEPRRSPPGLRGSKLPVPGAVLSARTGSPRTAEPLDHHDGAHGLAEGRPITRGAHAAGRARTGDFEIFSLALSQTELPRREACDHPPGAIVFGREARVI